MARQSLLFVVMAMVGQILAYLYQLTMARMLEPREYAVVLALVSLIAILLFPGNAFQTAVAVGVGHLIARSRAHAVWRFALHAAALGAVPAVALAVLFALLADPIRRVFGFEGTSVLVWLALTLILWMPVVAARGALQGSQRFAALGGVMAGDAAIRLATAAILVALGFGIGGATAGFAIGFAGSLLLGAWLLRPRKRQLDDVSGELWSTLRKQLPALPATFAVFGVQAFDVVVANARLPDRPLESFSAAALAGRAIFWGGFVLAILILPRFQRMFLDGAFRPTLVWGSLGLMGAGAIGGVAAGYLAPGLLHFLLVGPAYAQDVELMRTYLIGSALLATSLYLTYVLIAAAEYRVGYVVLPVAVAQATGYVLIADSALAFARILVVGAGIMTVCLLATTTMVLRRAGRAAAAAGTGKLGETASDVAIGT
jgi:O-antigen/teichoic acid export membrane protein